VPLQSKVCAGSDGIKRLWRQTGVNLHDATTLHTGKMMMVTTLCCCATNAIAMCSVAKLDAVEHALSD
jgi:hypothetical protein